MVVEADENGCKLFVGGLSHGTTDLSLLKYFESFGKVISAVVLRDPETLSSRGFGFVTFSSKKEAQNCLNFGNHRIDNKHVETKFALPRPAYLSNSNNSGGSPNANQSNSIMSAPSVVSTQSASGNTVASEGEYIETKIFVGGLLYATIADSLKEYFKKYGPVTMTEIIYNKETKISRGFGFVEFQEPSSVESVISYQTNNQRHRIDGKKVEVKRCLKRNDPHYNKSTTSTSNSNGVPNTSSTNNGSIQVDNSSKSSNVNPGPSNPSSSRTTNVGNSAAATPSKTDSTNNANISVPVKLTINKKKANANVKITSFAEAAALGTKHEKNKVKTAASLKGSIKKDFDGHKSNIPVNDQRTGTDFDFFDNTKTNDSSKIEFDLDLKVGTDDRDYNDLLTMNNTAISGAETENLFDKFEDVLSFKSLVGSDTKDISSPKAHAAINSELAGGKGLEEIPDITYESLVNKKGGHQQKNIWENFNKSNIFRSSSDLGNGNIKSGAVDSNNVKDGIDIDVFRANSFSSFEGSGTPTASKIAARNTVQEEFPKMAESELNVSAPPFEVKPAKPQNAGTRPPQAYPLQGNSQVPPQNPNILIQNPGNNFVVQASTNQQHPTQVPQPVQAFPAPNNNMQYFVSSHPTNVFYSPQFIQNGVYPSNDFNAAGAMGQNYVSFGQPNNGVFVPANYATYQKNTSVTEHSTMNVNTTMYDPNATGPQRSNERNLNQYWR